LLPEDDPTSLQHIFLSASPGSSDKSALQKKKSILAVDNKLDVNVLLRKILELNGYQATAYAVLAAALPNFKTGLFDLVDSKMRGINGFELYARIAEIDHSIKALFVSADSEHYAKYKKEFVILPTSRAHTCTSLSACTHL
jgi:CheY-like chemotaxis protein